MRFLRILPLVLALTWCPIYPMAEIQLGGQFSGVSYDEYSLNTQGKSAQRWGYKGQIFAHYMFNLWMPSAIGVGPYAGYGTLGNANDDVATISNRFFWRAGLEVKSAFRISQRLHFFTRFGAGYESHRNKVSVSSTTTEYDAPTTGISGHGGVGIQYLAGRNYQFFLQGEVLSANLTESAENVMVGGQPAGGIADKKRTMIAFGLGLGAIYRIR